MAEGDGGSSNIIVNKKRSRGIAYSDGERVMRDSRDVTGQKSHVNYSLQIYSEDADDGRRGGIGSTSSSSSFTSLSQRHLPPSSPARHQSDPSDTTTTTSTWKVLPSYSRHDFVFEAPIQLDPAALEAFLINQRGPSTPSCDVPSSFTTAPMIAVTLASSASDDDASSSSSSSSSSSGSSSCESSHCGNINSRPSPSGSSASNSSSSSHLFLNDIFTFNAPIKRSSSVNPDALSADRLKKRKLSHHIRSFLLLRPPGLPLQGTDGAADIHAIMRAPAWLKTATSELSRESRMMPKEWKWSGGEANLELWTTSDLEHNFKRACRVDASESREGELDLVTAVKVEEEGELGLLSPPQAAADRIRRTSAPPSLTSTLPSSTAPSHTSTISSPAFPTRATSQPASTPASPHRSPVDLPALKNNAPLQPSPIPQQILKEQLLAVLRTRLGSAAKAGELPLRMKKFVVWNAWVRRTTAANRAAGISRRPSSPPSSSSDDEHAGQDEQQQQQKSARRSHSRPVSPPSPGGTAARRAAAVVEHTPDEIEDMLDAESDEDAEQQSTVDPKDLLLNNAQSSPPSSSSSRLRSHSHSHRRRAHHSPPMPEGSAAEQDQQRKAEGEGERAASPVYVALFTPDQIAAIQQVNRNRAPLKAADQILSRPRRTPSPPRERSSRSGSPAPSSQSHGSSTSPAATGATGDSRASYFTAKRVEPNSRGEGSGSGSDSSSLPELGYTPSPGTSSADSAGSSSSGSGSSGSSSDGDLPTPFVSEHPLYTSHAHSHGAARQNLAPLPALAKAPLQELHAPPSPKLRPKLYRKTTSESALQHGHARRASRSRVTIAAES